jgi:hypothetical protein
MNRSVLVPASSTLAAGGFWAWTCALQNGAKRNTSIAAKKAFESFEEKPRVSVIVNFSPFERAIELTFPPHARHTNCRCDSGAESVSQSYGAMRKRGVRGEGQRCDNVRNLPAPGDAETGVWSNVSG